MLITRKVGKIVRGGATPLQILMACVLGSVLGFVPGFMQAPGLIAAAVLLLILLNANFFLAATVGLAAGFLNLLIMPVTFGVGRVLLEGPAQPLFKAAINAPVLALFGLDHYATTGGLFMGIVFGVAVGLLLSALLRRFWRRMARVEGESERYKKVMGRKSVRTLAWIFIGPASKKSFDELARRKIGNPIRPLGVVFAILAGALVTIAYLLVGEQITTTIVQKGLERANGATVDVRTAKLDLKSGKMYITGLAMADPADLTTDLLRAATVEADVGGTDLLRKRITIDRLLLADATQGEKRAFPGRLVGRRAKPEPPPREPDDRTLEDYIREAEQWKERLAQVREWLEKVSGGETAGEPTTGPDGKPVIVREETLRERLEREIAALGYRNVRATHLVEGAPTVLVRLMEAQGVRSRDLGDDLVDVRAENVSTHPRLVDGSPKVTVKSRSGRLDALADLGVSLKSVPATIRFALSGLETDRVAGWMVPTDPPLIRGGTTDVRLEGTLGADGFRALNVPLRITLHNAVVSLPKAGSANVAQLIVPVDVRGTLDSPRLRVDQKQLSDALVQAGAGELVNKARAEADKAAEKALDKATDKLTEKIGGETTDKARDAIRGLIPGGKR